MKVLRIILAIIMYIILFIVFWPVAVFFLVVFLVGLLWLWLKSKAFVDDLYGQSNDDWSTSSQPTSLPSGQIIDAEYSEKEIEIKNE